MDVVGGISMNALNPPFFTWWESVKTSCLVLLALLIQKMTEKWVQKTMQAPCCPLAAVEIMNSTPSVNKEERLRTSNKPKTRFGCNCSYLKPEKVR